MMLIITDTNSYKAIQYLTNNTNKNFCFKQLLELCQLICSCGISNVYKKIPQGKNLQEWILKNKWWTLNYFNELLDYVKVNIKLNSETEIKFKRIQKDLCDSVYWKDIPETAIWRYKQGYISDYETNTELPINIAVEEYKKYINIKNC